VTPGKPIRKALARSYMESAELPLLGNIKKMHSACKSRLGIPSSVLDLVSQAYTIEASEENFSLVDYGRHPLSLKTKVSDQAKAKVSGVLYESSNITFSTVGPGGNGLMTCPLSLPDPSKYFNICFRVNVKRDIRTNKYAHDRSNSLGSGTEIMGSTSRNTQRTRVEMLRGIRVSLRSKLYFNFR
ncbi:hypothetical protein BB560_006390, partial [Smittium megazygosporum]